VSRVYRIALIAEGLVLLGLAVVWAFREYAGSASASFLAAPPFPCPFHAWR